MRIVKQVFLLCLLLNSNLTMVAYDALVDGIYYNLDKVSRATDVTYRDSCGHPYRGDIVLVYLSDMCSIIL